MYLKKVTSKTYKEKTFFLGGGHLGRQDTDEKSKIQSQIRKSCVRIQGSKAPDPAPYQNVTDPEHR
jgi:hypothetical protein